MNAPTLLGHVGSVAGSTVSVRQFEGVASGIAIIGGRSYRVGQVGSFVRIPQGYHDLYAIISEVGASATPVTLVDALDRGERWLTVQLIGEIVEASFERGISQYPNLNDEVHLVTEEDLAKIYGAEFSGQVIVGRLANAESIPVRLDLDKLVTRHSAVLGSTGSGKSTTVSSLLRSISAPDGAGFPSARILLLDIHGEYASALADNAEIFRITPGVGEKQLVIPYWALRPAEILNFLCGKLDDRATTAILDKIFAAKSAIAQADNLPGVDLNSMTVDSPIPYSLRNLWLELIEPEGKTWLLSLCRRPDGGGGRGRHGDHSARRRDHASSTSLPAAHNNEFSTLPEQRRCARNPQAARPNAITYARSSVRVPAQAR